MNLIKKILGFDSQYSWMKWLKISFAAVALIVTLFFWGNFGFLIIEGGLIGIIIGLVIFVVMFVPIAAIMLGISAIVGGVLSGRKQYKSFKETAAEGSAEMMDLEKLRMKSQVLDFAFILTIPILIIVGYFLLSNILDSMYDNFGENGIEAAVYGYIILAVVILIVFWIKKAPVKARYKSAFKEGVVTKGLDSVFKNMDFRPKETLNEDIVKSAALFPNYDVYSGNDYLAAEYNGHRFVQSDINLQQRREERYWDDGKLKTRIVYDTIFCGRFMVFDYDAISDEPVAVYDRQGSKAKDTETVKTELDAFNQRFYITAANPMDALRILTPQVLEGIVLASGKLGYPMYLSFREDKLFVALASGDAFEAAGGDTTIAEQRRRVTDDINAMLELIDTLYLKN